MDAADALRNGRLTLQGGEFNQEDSKIPRYTKKRCSRQEAEQIVHWKMASRDILMFDVDQPIARIDQLQELTVKLSWKDVPLDKLRLTDGRQSIVSETNNAGQHEAILRIASPNLSVAPVDVLTESERKELVAKSRYLDPTDPEILSHAREWTKDCKTSREIVTALAEHVFQHVRAETVAETLSGPEVLKCKKGKCSEYSTLFASLARALNIPTRIVLGESMGGGYWAGHMWNEVFIDEIPIEGVADQRTGRWVTVDASAKEVGTAPGLLKLTHSATVMGTQPARYDLTDSLDISVVNFSMNSGKAVEGWKTGIVENTYTNADYGLRITAPDKTWTFEPSAKAGAVVIRLRLPKEDRVQLHVVGLSLPVTVDAKYLLTIRNTAFQTKYKEYKVEGPNPETLNGREWQTMQFTRAMSAEELKQHPGGKTMKTTEYLSLQGNVGCLINLICDESVHKDHIDDLRKVVATVVLKEPVKGDDKVEAKTSKVRKTGE